MEVGLRELLPGHPATQAGLATLVDGAREHGQARPDGARVAPTRAGPERLTPLEVTEATPVDGQMEATVVIPVDGLTEVAWEVSLVDGAPVDPVDGSGKMFHHSHRYNCDLCSKLAISQTANLV